MLFGDSVYGALQTLVLREMCDRGNWLINYPYSYLLLLQKFIINTTRIQHSTLLFSTGNCLRYNSKFFTLTEYGLIYVRSMNRKCIFRNFSVPEALPDAARCPNFLSFIL